MSDNVAIGTQGIGELPKPLSLPQTATPATLADAVSFGQILGSMLDAKSTQPAVSKEPLPAKADAVQTPREVEAESRDVQSADDVQRKDASAGRQTNASDNDGKAEVRKADDAAKVSDDADVSTDDAAQQAVAAVESGVIAVDAPRWTPVDTLPVEVQQTVAEFVVDTALPQVPEYSQVIPTLGETAETPDAGVDSEFMSQILRLMEAAGLDEQNAGTMQFDVATEPGIAQPAADMNVTEVPAETLSVEETSPQEAPVRFVAADSAMETPEAQLETTVGKPILFTTDDTGVETVRVDTVVRATQPVSEENDALIAEPHMQATANVKAFDADTGVYEQAVVKPEVVKADEAVKAQWQPLFQHTFETPERSFQVMTAAAQADVEPAAAEPTVRTESILQVAAKAAAQEVAPVQNQTGSGMDLSGGGHGKTVEWRGGEVSGPAQGGSSQFASELERARGTQPSRQLQMIQQLAEAMRNASGKLQHSIRMTLQPESLGQVRVDMVMRGGTVHATAQVESQAVNQVLINNLDSLRESLAQHGIDLGAFSVSVGGGEAGDSHPSKHQSPRHEMSFAAVGLSSRAESESATELLSYSTVSGAQMEWVA